jgi:hypothetical protein
MVAQAPHRAAGSHTGRGPGGPADRRGLSGPARRPSAVAPHALGRPAGRPGPRGHHQSSGCPHHAHKTARTPWPQQPGVLPPHAHAACVGAMEDVRAVDTRPAEPRRPPVCLDETSTPLVAETRVPLPAAPGQPARLDDEDERQGTAHLCMVFEPVAGQRRGKVTARRTASACAQVLQEVVDEPSPQAETLVRVMDHLNTHTLASR